MYTKFSSLKHLESKLLEGLSVGIRVILWAGIAQSVWRLATVWTVRGSNPGGGRDFPHPFRPALRPTQPPIQWVPGLSRRLKRPLRGVDHRPPSSAEVKERVEHTYSTPLGLRGLL